MYIYANSNWLCPFVEESGNHNGGQMDSAPGRQIRNVKREATSSGQTEGKIIVRVLVNGILNRQLFSLLIYNNSRNISKFTYLYFIRYLRSELFWVVFCRRNHVSETGTWGLTSLAFELSRFKVLWWNNISFCFQL